MEKVTIEFSIKDKNFHLTTPIDEVRKHCWNRTTSFYEALRAYLEAALWSSVAYGDPEEENYGDHFDADFDLADISDEFLKESAECVGMTHGCFSPHRQRDEFGQDLDQEDLYLRDLNGDTIDDLWGHDLWLTRAGHGAGFWDGDWEEEYGTRLTSFINTKFRNVDPYLGDDGKIYAM